MLRYEDFKLTRVICVSAEENVHRWGPAVVEQNTYWEVPA